MASEVTLLDNKMDNKKTDIDASSKVEETEDEQKETLTKSQLKKLKKKEKWQQVKAQKRKAEKERQKARKKACRERGEELGPSRKQLSKNKMKNSSCKIKVAIDCDFDDYMADKDIKMLVKQIQFSYSANRRATSPMQFYCCGVTNKTKERLESLGDYKGWDIYFHTESYSQMFDTSSIVYLSSESPNVLETLDEDKVYIIGGLVDHNHHKGLCHKLAEERGLNHAQLPISEYIDMKTRKVLTINHVFEILLRYTETKDWQKAFYTVLPPRKGAVLKNNTDTKPCDKCENSRDSEINQGLTKTSDRDGEDSNEHDPSRETDVRLTEGVDDGVNENSESNSTDRKTTETSDSLTDKELNSNSIDTCSTND